MSSCPRVLYVSFSCFPSAALFVVDQGLSFHVLFTLFPFSKAQVSPKNVSNPCSLSLRNHTDQALLFFYFCSTSSFLIFSSKTCLPSVSRSMSQTFPTQLDILFSQSSCFQSVKYNTPYHCLYYSFFKVLQLVNVHVYLQTQKECYNTEIKQNINRHCLQ